MTAQLDRMREALAAPSHPAGCRCAVCATTAAVVADRADLAPLSARLGEIECEGVSDYTELDVDVLLTAAFRNQVHSELELALTTCVHAFAAAGLISFDAATQIVAELVPASADVPPLGTARPPGLTSSATPTSG